MTDPHNSDTYAEVTNIVTAFELDFLLGTAVANILRNSKNPDPLRLRKARWYLTRKLEATGDEATGFNAAHNAKDGRHGYFKDLADDIAASPDENLRSVLQGVFIQGFQAAYEHLGLRFDG